MAYRRILFTLTALSALLLVGSLSLVVHTRSERAEQPVRIEQSRALLISLDQLNDRVDRLAAIADLADLQQARRDLAEVVLAFDQELLALIETARDKRATDAISEIQTIWRDLGLGLADLAAGDYAASSAAGRQAVALLRRESPAMRQYLQNTATALQGAEDHAHKLGGFAATGTAILGGLTLLLGLAASRPPRSFASGLDSTSKSAPRDSTGAGADRSDMPPSHDAAAPTASIPAGRPGVSSPGRSPSFVAGRPAGPFDTHIDLGLASAAVDRVTMDMGTVARSTERMQLAVDSVASALQGMLFSLNEMAQDTFEGSRLTRTAHNSAVYAADTARELIESARDMGAVVARVRTLAARSQDIAGRIQGDAAATGATGEAFTSVVAQEVKQLAAATGDAAARIEATVDEILAGQRQYEEAIGQIIKNIGAVRKVAAGMGELMLAPPERVQPGTQYAAAATPAPAPAPEPPPVAAPATATAPEPPAVAAPQAPASDQTFDEPLPDILDDPDLQMKAEELTAVTSDLLDELAEVAAEIAAEPAPAAASAAEPKSAPEEAPPPAAAETAETTEVTKEDEQKTKPSGSSGNVFMLKGPPKKAAAKPKASEPPPEQPVAESSPAAEPEPAPKQEAAAPEDPSPENEQEQEPVGAAAGPGKPRPVAQGAGGNIFMLNKPKKS